jgi:hypothetical protein
MTRHLTDEQLGAKRDGALSAGDAAGADRHLAECAECRARLADLAALDADLAGALEHDPGEAYFAAFADRVAARIASGAPAAVPAANAPRRGIAAWWSSPRRLAWAGGALGMVAVAALVVTLARDHGPQEMATQVAPPREVGAASGAPRAESAGDKAEEPGADAAARRKVMAQAPAPTSAEGAAPGAAASRTFASAPAAGSTVTPTPVPVPAPAPVADVPMGIAARADVQMQDETAAPPKPQAQVVEPKRMVEVRTLPNGEQEIVSRGPQLKRAPVPPLRLPGGFSKPAAEPLAGKAPPVESLSGGMRGAKSAMDALQAPLATPAPAEVPPPAGDYAPDAREAGAKLAGPAVAICGTVRDARGRPAARALVAVAGTGASVTAGADGTFCVDVPASGGTLSVLAVGYRPYRMEVTAADARANVAITLAGVDVLAPSERGGSLGIASRIESRGRVTGGSLVARRQAIDASAAARKAATAGAWTTAAERWETVALLEPAASDDEPGFRAAEARFNAWRIGRGEAQREAARNATRTYLEHAPAGASRDIALGWKRALER